MKTSSSELTSKSEPSSPSYIDGEARHRMVSEAAYFIAECRGFSGGCPVDDWLQAEAEINRSYPIHGDTSI